MSETVFSIWLSLGLGPGGDHRKLFNSFSDVCEIYRAEPGELLASGISPVVARRLGNKDLAEAARIARFCEKQNISLCIYGQPGYPERLAETETPPFLLYVLGRMPEFGKRLGLGIVGSREMSGYGMRTAYRTAYETAAAGAVVVSGMARGIDGTAAAGALEAGGTTVAVTGCGLDTVYPSEHEKLMRAIAENGAVISEYPPGSPPVASHFPVRNRIISGLSDGVVIVEAGLKSGAMLTADIAGNQGRDVFAVPGRIEDEFSAGTNLLIDRGARILLSGGDLLSHYIDRYPVTLSTDSYARATVSSSLDLQVLEKYGVRPSKDSDAGAVRSPVFSGRAEAVVSGRAGASKGSSPATAKPAAATRAGLPPEGEQRELYLLIPRGERVGADFFAERGYSPEHAMKLLSILEISGFITGVPGGMYVL